VRERATETKKVIFQRVAGFISATRFLKSRRSGETFLPFTVEKPGEAGFSTAWNCSECLFEAAVGFNF
jgi:hypothetical protein